MKHSKIVVFLSLLLVAIMAFSSCSGSAAAIDDDAQLNIAPMEENRIELLDKESSSSDDQTLRDAMQDNKDAISAAVKKWQEYLGFNASENEVEKFQLAYSNIPSDFKITNVTRSGAIVKVTTEKYVWSDVEHREVLAATRIFVYNLYSANPSQYIYSTEAYAPFRSSEYKHGVQYSVTPNSNGFSFSVVKNVYSPSFGEDGAFVEYNRKCSSYLYTNSSTPIASAVDKDSPTGWYISDSNYDGYYEVSVEDKTYALNGKGEIVKTFDKGFERVLPGEPDYTVNNLKYYYEDNAIKVLNSNFDYVSSYSFLTGYSRSSYVLPNGNVFVQYKKALSNDAKTYAYEQNGTKYDLIQQIFVPASGEVKSVELGYVVTKLSDNENYTTTNFKLKDDANFVVNALKYTKGEATSNANFASLVLKGDFELVVELPKIVMNQKEYDQFEYDQFEYAQFVTLNKLIIRANFGGRRDAYFLVDRDGNCDLLPMNASFGKTGYNLNGEYFTYEGTNGDFEKPYEDFREITSFAGTTVLRFKNSDYLTFYYYNAKEGRYASSSVYCESDNCPVFGSVIMLDIDGDYYLYDATGNRLLGDDSVSCTRAAGGYYVVASHTVQENNVYRTVKTYYFVK